MGERCEQRELEEVGPPIGVCDCVFKDLVFVRLKIEVSTVHPKNAVVANDGRFMGPRWCCRK